MPDWRMTVTIDLELAAEEQAALDRCELLTYRLQEYAAVVAPAGEISLTVSKPNLNEAMLHAMHVVREATGASPQRIEAEQL